MLSQKQREDWIQAGRPTHDKRHDFALLDVELGPNSLSLVTFVGKVEHLPLDLRGA